MTAKGREGKNKKHRGGKIAVGLGALSKITLERTICEIRLRLVKTQLCPVRHLAVYRSDAASDSLESGCGKKKKEGAFAPFCVNQKPLFS